LPLSKIKVALKSGWRFSMKARGSGFYGGPAKAFKKNKNKK
jgi:hypothetical protein